MQRDTSLLPLLSDALIERYEPIGVLGHGAFAMVIKALDRKTQAPVAIKHFMIRGGDKRKFFRELQVILRLNHPNIVRCLDLIDSDEASSDLIFEYADCGTLRDLLPGDQRIPIDRALPFLIMIARGLVYAHDLGIVHRDLKPENVLFVGEGPDQIAKITDFGIARYIGMHSKAATSIGSPAYMAPEQFYDTYDFKSDVYAFGILFFEMLHGDVPFVGSHAKVFQGHQNDTLPCDPVLPGSVRDLMTEAAAKKPVQRPTAKLLLARLIDLAEELGLQIPPAPAPEVAPKVQPPTAPRPHSAQNLFGDMFGDDSEPQLPPAPPAATPTAGSETPTRTDIDIAQANVDSSSFGETPGIHALKGPSPVTPRKAMNDDEEAPTSLFDDNPAFARSHETSDRIPLQSFSDPAPSPTEDLYLPADESDDDPFAAFDHNPAFTSKAQKPVTPAPQKLTPILPAPIPDGDAEDPFGFIDNNPAFAQKPRPVVVRAPALAPPAAPPPLRESMFGEGFEDVQVEEVRVTNDLIDLNKVATASAGKLELKCLWTRTVDTTSLRVVNMDAGGELLLVTTKGIYELKGDGRRGNVIYGGNPTLVGMPSRGSLPIVADGAIQVIGINGAKDQRWPLEGKVDQGVISPDQSAVALVIGKNVCYHDAGGSQLWTARLDPSASEILITFDDANRLIIASFESEDQTIHYYDKEGGEVANNWLPGRIVSSTRPRSAAGAWTLVQLKRGYQLFRTAGEGMQGYVKTESSLKRMMGGDGWVAGIDADGQLVVLDPMRGNKASLELQGVPIDFELGPKGDRLYVLERRGELLKYVSAWEIILTESDERKSSDKVGVKK